MDIFNNLQVINECLLDVKRTEAFEKAINATIQDHHVVMDAGTGTGILGLLAARAGAKKVYSVDIAEDTIMQAKKNIAASPYKNKITVLCQDLKKFNEPVKVNVLIMEMLDTGLVSEQQAVALNNLRKNKTIDEHTILIPYKAECYVEAIDYDFNFYGFEMPCIIQARNYGANDKIIKVLSDSILYQEIDFRKYIDTTVDTAVEIPIKVSGHCNAIRMRTRVALTKKQRMWGTPDMNMPIIIPIKNSKANRGDSLTVRIKYKMGEGFAHFYADIE